MRGILADINMAGHGDALLFAARFRPVIIVPLTVGTHRV
jgi:hypothetical protein